MLKYLAKAKNISIKCCHSFSKPFISLFFFSFQILLLLLKRFRDNRMEKRQDWYVTACVFIFLSLASQIHCTKEKDLIKNLPGQPPVSFKQYGGYVSVNEKAGRFLYYYFVEAIKPTNSTPLVIWFNGGTFVLLLIRLF